MARKARGKSAIKASKKRSTGTMAQRKAAASKRSKPARRKAAPKPKGIIADVTGGFEAIIDTLSEAERLRHKLEPRMAADPE